MAIRSASRQMSAGQTAHTEAWAGMVSRMVEDTMTGVDLVVAGFAPSGDGLKFHAAIGTVDGTVLGEMVREQGASEMSGLSMLPAGMVVFAAGSLRGERTWQYIADMTVEMTAAAAPTPENAERRKAFASESIAAQRAAGLGDNFAGGLSFSEEGRFESSAIYQVNDAGKALEAVIPWTKEMKLGPGGVGSMGPAGIEVGEVEESRETIAGVPVTALRMPVDWSGAQPMQARIMQNMFGSDITVRFAGRDGRLFVAVASDSSVIEKMLSGERGGRLDTEKINRSRSSIGSSLNGAVFLSLPDCSARMFAMTMLGAAREVVVPETSEYAAAVIACEGSSVVVTANVPIEEILAAKDVFDQAMQSMTQRKPPSIESTNGRIQYEGEPEVEPADEEDWDTEAEEEDSESESGAEAE